MQEDPSHGASRVKPTATKKHEAIVREGYVALSICQLLQGAQDRNGKDSIKKRPPLPGTSTALVEHEATAAGSIHRASHSGRQTEAIRDFHCQHNLLVKQPPPQDSDEATQANSPVRGYEPADTGAADPLDNTGRMVTVLNPERRLKFFFEKCQPETKMLCQRDLNCRERGRTIRLTIG